MAVNVSKEELLSNLQKLLGEDLVSSKDLERPSSDFMMKYFFAVLSAFGVDPMKMIKSSEVQRSLNVEQLRQVVQFNAVYNAVLKVYPIPKYLTGFSLFSLMEPKPSDIQYVAVLDNFYQYWLNLTESLLDPHLMELEEKRKILNEKEKLNEDLQQWLNDKAALRSKRDLEKVKIVEDIKVLDSELNGEKAEMQQLEEELAEEEKEIEELRKEKEDCLVEEERQLELRDVKVNYRQLKDSIKQEQATQDEKEAVLAGQISTLQEKMCRQNSVERNLTLEEQMLQMIADYQTLVTEANKCQKNALKSEHNVEIILKKLQEKKMKFENLKTKKKDVEIGIEAAKHKHADLAKQENEITEECQLISEKENKIVFLQEQCKKFDEKLKSIEVELQRIEQDFLSTRDILCAQVKEVTRNYISTAKESFL